jgi:hypothetical protein
MLHGPLQLLEAWEKQGVRRKLLFYARALDAPRWQSSDLMQIGFDGLIDGDGLTFEITERGRAALEKAQRRVAGDAA